MDANKHEQRQRELDRSDAGHCYAVRSGQQH
jgi:hypothetical protein